MPVPGFVEGNVYTRAVKRHHARIAVTTAPRYWTQQMEEQFGVDGELDAAEWWYTQYGGEHPLVESNTIKFALRGGPPREMIISRKHWLPERDDLAFEVQIIGIFEQLVDPIYAAVMTVGGIDNFFGVEAEPMRIIQKGSANVSGASIGKIFIDSGGVIEDSAAARVNDSNPHTYICRWNPFAVGVPGDEILTVLYDGVIQHETSDPISIQQPHYIALNMIQSTRDGVPVTGSPGLPYFTLLVDSVITREYNGGGYETQLEPSWTTTDLGNDIDTAVDGERFVMDGENWAKVFKDNIVGWEVTVGRDNLFDTFTVTIAAPDQDDPVTTPNVFADMRWVGRTIVIDTRMEDEAFTDPLDQYTTWKRQICGEIDDVTIEDGVITISGRERAMGRLDSFISRAYTNIAGDGDQDGEIEGVNVGYLIGDVLVDLVEVSNAIAGGRLPATSSLIQAPDVLPQALSSGGESLAPVFAELCDRLCQEVWTFYDLADPAAAYGQIMVNLWTFEGEGSWRFWGRGNEYEDVQGATFAESRRDGVGQSFYRQQTPLLGDLLQSLEFLPLVGTFPSAPFPVNDRVVSDSLAGIETTGLSVLLGFPDKFGTDQAGGLAKFRYKRENAQRRRVQLTVEGQDWMQPTDGFRYVDRTMFPADFGYEELFVTSNLRKTWADGVLTVAIDAVTAEIVRAIVRGSGSS